MLYAYHSAAPVDQPLKELLRRSAAITHMQPDSRFVQYRVRPVPGSRALASHSLRFAGG